MKWLSYVDNQQRNKLSSYPYSKVETESSSACEESFIWSSLTSGEWILFFTYLMNQVKVSGITVKKNQSTRYIKRSNYFINSIFILSIMSCHIWEAACKILAAHLFLTYSSGVVLRNIGLPRQYRLIELNDVHKKGAMANIFQYSLSKLPKWVVYYMAQSECLDWVKDYLTI